MNEQTNSGIMTGPPSRANWNKFRYGGRASRVGGSGRIARRLLRLNVVGHDRGQRERQQPAEQVAADGL